MTIPPDVRARLDEKYTKYFSAYGTFLALWLHFDLLVEMLIKRELRLTTRESSIVCAGLQFGVKFNILLSLLARNRPWSDKTIALLRAVQSAAKRNTVAHSFLTFHRGDPEIRRVKRDIQGGRYSLDIQPLHIRSHSAQFIKALDELMDHLHIGPEEIENHGRELIDDAKGPPDQAIPRPESPPSS